MSTPIVLGLIRHILTVAGGYLVAQGTLTSGDLTELIGGIVALVGVGWSVYAKRGAGQQNPPPDDQVAPDDPAPRSTFSGMVLIAGLGLLVLAILGGGCASAGKAVTANIRLQCGTNSVTVSQPKDTIIERLEFDPTTGRLVLYGYQSTANAAAVEAMRAQAEMQRQTMAQGIRMIESLAERAAQSQGVPIAPRSAPAPAAPVLTAPAAAPPTSAAANAPAVSVRDDPSKPWIQLDLEPAPPPANP